jgi:hypothetical protein
MTTKVTLLNFCERVPACHTGLIMIFVYCLLKGCLETFVMYAEECLLQLILQCNIFFSLTSGPLEFNSYYLLSEIHNVLDKNLVHTWIYFLALCCFCCLYALIISLYLQFHELCTFNSCRFHPSCMGMTIEQAKKIDHYMCSDCVKENGAKRPSNSYPVSPNSDAKVSAFFSFSCIWVDYFSNSCLQV